MGDKGHGRGRFQVEGSTHQDLGQGSHTDEVTFDLRSEKLTTQKS